MHIINKSGAGFVGYALLVESCVVCITYKGWTI